MDDRKDVTVPMEGSLLEDIDAQLTYGDSRSEWIRDACRRKLAAGEDESAGDDGADATAGA